MGWALGLLGLLFCELSWSVIGVCIGWPVMFKPTNLYFVILAYLFTIFFIKIKQYSCLFTEVFKINHPSSFFFVVYEWQRRILIISLYCSD